jgi:hypothetical protein
MRDTEIITFSFEGQGEIKLTVARCRELCPSETAALEEAADSMAAAGENMQALAIAAEETGRRLNSVKDALIAKGQQRMVQLRDDTTNNE